MTFQDDEGNIIDVAGQFGMTKQALSLFNGSIKGDVSLNFTFDNNSENRRTLGYDGPNMTNQVAFTKQAFKRIKDGNILDRGYIVIQDENGDELNCFYISGNANWINRLTGLIRNLDWSNYEVPYTATSVHTTYLSATEGIIFPVVDWAYNFKNGGNTYSIFGGPDSGTNYSYGLFDSSRSQDKYFSDFFPCLYLSTLLKEALQQNGIKLSGNILQDKKYQSLIVTPTNGKMTREPIDDLVLYGSSYTVVTSPGYEKYTNFFLNSAHSIDSSSRWSNQRYTATINSILVFRITQVTATYATFAFTLAIYKNGVSYTTTSLAGSGKETYRYYILASAGDYFEIYVRNNNGTPSSITLDMTIEIPTKINAGDYVNPSHFLPKLKCSDIVKFVANYFGAVVYYDEHSSNLSINIIDKYKAEDAEDWSQYYISHRSEYTVERAANNYIRLSQPSELDPYNDDHTTKFGEGNIQTDNTLKENADFISLNAVPSKFGVELNGQYMSSVPLVNLQDSGDPIAYSAIASVSALVSKFTVPDALKFLAGEVIRIENSSGVNLGYYSVSGASGTDLSVMFTFVATGTGYIYKQLASFNEAGFRILEVKPNTSLSDFGSVSSMNIRYYSGGGVLDTTKSALPYAVFTKGFTGYNIDQWPANCAIENIDDSNYTDPTVRVLYWQKIANMVGKPTIRFQMLLPVSAYQTFKFDKFVFIKAYQITGYFWIDSIVNYVDGNTPVEVNAYML